MTEIELNGTEIKIKFEGKIDTIGYHTIETAFLDLMEEFKKELIHDRKFRKILRESFIKSLEDE